MFRVVPVVTALLALAGGYYRSELWEATEKHAPRFAETATMLVQSFASRGEGGCPLNCYMFATTKQSDANAHWTLHGLWPQCASKGQKAAQWVGCCTDERLDEDVYNELLPLFRRYWTTANHQPKQQRNCSCECPEHWFIRHEWEKHGTCTNPLMGQKTYFLTAMYILQFFEKRCPEKPRYNSGLNTYDCYTTVSSACVSCAQNIVQQYPTDFSAAGDACKQECNPAPNACPLAKAEECSACGSLTKSNTPSNCPWPQCSSKCDGDWVKENCSP